VTRITQAPRASSDTTHMDKRSEHTAHAALSATARMRMTPAQLEALARAEAERLETLKRLGL